MLASSKKGSNFAAQKTKNGPLAQLNRAFDYGSKGYRFESCRDHSKNRWMVVYQLFGGSSFCKCPQGTQNSYLFTN